MGTSFTEFNGKGFWTRDIFLEVWLGALVQEIDHLSSPSEWLTLIRPYWHLQATAGFLGCVSPDLDRLVTTYEEKHLLIALSEQAITTLAAYGNVIPCDILNAMTLDETISPHEEYFAVDVPPKPFLRVGSTFIQLLKGELTTTSEDGKASYVGE
jgi:hypothetical protein